MVKKDEKISFEIDGQTCSAWAGQPLLDAAKDNGIFIPSLCHVQGLKPAGSCRICNVNVNGRNMTACTTRVSAGMVVENHTPELNELRKTIIEVLFVSGNHFCPSCEKSGNCELQALGYRYQMMVPRFPYEFPVKGVDARPDLIYHDRNRCIMCKRCVRSITKDGKHVFALNGRGGEHLHVAMDVDLASQLTEAEAQEAMDICPVGAILKKEQGFLVPIGERKYDKAPIGSDIEAQNG
ncbi:MAG: NADP oxidoreductase [Chloroflexi bacterium]|nr:MAG: NADP oxidoreductase [Chloroflexota bacterium]MBL1195712.1 NADP oxidoreductase [Chloroflexota bacterium]NOH13000.1 2Fe-2S iron-sulfur cluster binding domain-containing protein [Chloroflexota bacterium]